MPCRTRIQRGMASALPAGSRLNECYKGWGCALCQLTSSFMARPVSTIPWKPTRQQLAAALDRKVPDIIEPGLRVLFCGINPGLYSAAVGHHFARPGNRFWPALQAGGFTDRLLSPFEERQILLYGCGITNIVDRASASADDLTPDELHRGARRVGKKVRQYRPRFVAFLGVTAYRTAFCRTHAKLGSQPDSLGDSCIWLLPNPSGLNAHYQPRELARLFGELRQAAEAGT
jgi:double-stranded uracil-DNA glycosylase